MITYLLLIVNFDESPGKKKPSNDLLSHGVSPEVSSALKGLTAVFEMGTGGAPSL